MRKLHSRVAFLAMMARSLRLLSPSYKATSCFILLLMMALKPYSAAEVDQTNNQIEETISVQEFHLLMKRSVQQEHTIGMLENQLENHEDRVRFLEKILLEKSPIMSNDDDINIIDHESNYNIGPLFNHREKRPVRLFPAHMLNGRREKKDENQTRKMPSSCSDLNLIGHTLNGFYLVKENNKDVNSTKMQTVYCDFQPPVSSSSSTKVGAPNLTEKRLGYVEMKSSSSGEGVYFYVQGSNSLCKLKGPTILRYYTSKLNSTLKGGMNTTTGVFTAPKSGIYHFDFAGLDKGDLEQLVIQLRLNDIHIGYTYSPAVPMFSTVAIHSTLRLKRGDKIRIHLEKGTFENCPSCIHFTGRLLEEESSVIF